MGNIERFNELCGQIFADLYESFPERRNLEAIQYNPPDEQNLDAGTKFAWETMVWLEESNYIKAKSYTNGRKMDLVTLTPKGLETLKLVPSSLDTSRSLGDHLVEATASGSRDAAGQLVSRGLTALFEASFRVAGGG